MRQADASGTPNPVAGVVDHAISLGDSQSGNFIRTFIHLGFNQDTQNRIVWDGAFPRIAARQTPINLRFALPGGAAGMYEPGSDGVVWWTRYADKARGLKAAGLLDRCAATKTCPKIVEAFGSAEFWGLRMSPDLIGTDATRDLALPPNVRRYYYPGTTHGGGRGGFPVEAIAAANSPCTLPANPNPQAEQTRALTRALVDWVAKGTPPPLSRYPTLANGDLVPATRAALGMPEIPGLPFSDRLLNPVLRYDFGPGFHAADLSGVMTRRPAAGRRRPADLRPARQRGRQRNVGRPVGAAAGAARHLSRMEYVPRRRLRGTRLRIPGGLDSFREDESGTDRQPRSAAVARGALRHARRVCRGGQESGGAGGQGPFSAAR